ncbi:hypothetical protein F8M41_007895 [Gigaspora margarita]|uniref:Uncharacterized protein n=1 Tax=Gigaspora margarita TaxID=4874 RepID=A0A8H4ER21_GIGMA|nr:hypothetical protein F8M41_007895 [Gigaspora margarita]
MAVTFKRRLEKKVFNEHSIQSIATTILNITWALYGIGQAYEVFFTIKDIKSLSECVIEEQIPDETLVEEIETYHNTVIVEDIACVILLLLFAIAMACISYKLHQHFGWNNYKKIGGDPRLQTAYKNYLTFLMLLKLNLSSILLFIIPSIFLVWFDNKYTNSTIHNILIFHFVITISMPFLEIIAYKSAAKENKIGMIIFLASWVIVTADLVMLFIGLTIKLRSFNSCWYSGIILIISLFTNCVLLIIFGIKVYKNFGYGVNKFIERLDGALSPTLPLPTVSLNNIWNRSGKEELDAVNGRWTIDD